MFFLSSKALVTHKVKKGIKLDFKSVAVVEASLHKLQELSQRVVM